MIFSEKLRLYNEQKSRYANNSNYLSIMRHLAILLDKDDTNMEGRSFQEIKLDSSSYAVQIAGTDPVTGEYRDNLKVDAEMVQLKEEVEAEDFEW